MSRELELLKEVVKLLEQRENTEAVKDEPVNDSYLLSTLNTGDVFKIGEYDFIVLEQMDRTTAVISKYLMMNNVSFSEDTRDYNKSAIKHLIETIIQPKIEVSIGEDNLVEHTVDLTSVDMQNEFGTCICKVRPITFDEARKYNDMLVNKDLPNLYWTCTPWSTEKRGYKYSIAVVSGSGCIVYNCSYFSSSGVRPFCILKSNIFVSKGEN